MTQCARESHPLIRYILTFVFALSCVSTAAAQCVNINSAPLEDLQRIVHIGPERAAEIIAKRPFGSVDDLTRVSGIAAGRLADIKAQGLACVQSSTPAPPAPTPPPAPDPGPVVTDRITVAIASRQVLPDALRVLLVSGEVLTIPSSQLVYVRDEWPHWNDDDGDCQDARQEVLIAESQTSVTLDEAGCRVLSGHWVDPLSGEVITDPSKLDVDHMVPLAHAFRAGGWGWDKPTRTQYANFLVDPWHLVALSASVNRSKGDRSPDEWRPPQRAAWCGYAREWKMVKQRWLLVVSSAEQLALDEMLATCGS